MKRVQRRLLSAAIFGSVVAGAAILGQRTFAEDAAAPTIKEIMKVAHQGDKKNNVDPLCKVIVSGKGTHDTADELLKLYKALAAAKPPKGDAEDWTKRTSALVDAAQELDKGDKPSAAAIATYKKALDCKGCHTEHKPK